MRLSEAVRQADMMRPNTVPEPEKRKWVMGLEAEIAEMLNRRLTSLDEQDDPELMIPAPQDTAYVLYLAAYIDYYQEEMELWQIDTIVANQAVAEAKAMCRRTLRKRTPKITGVFI